ncbi:hypothetical protein F2P45_15655 [Massilia sp. CCM 8733]|uniref:Uncharacterized protein n=1 Tax=Massilia mucilaginosa TaxID=2609282 RepID=A0ABX0NU81_9BURK|nr:hypothetical protein [Massilia mucilaginosa]NHZ90443.1 hypothetical protein [Massilia mucilaginosa]
MKKKLAVGVMMVLMAGGRAWASPAAAGVDTVLPPIMHDEASTLHPAGTAPATIVGTAFGDHRSLCASAGLFRHVAGGDPLANLRDAHKDPQRCKLSICIPASINLDAVCELTTARDSEGRYNCRMVINDFLRHCAASCHSGDWSWLDNYRGPY